LVRTTALAVRGHRRLLAAFALDALGTGAFIPFSLLYFQATSGLTLGVIGLALSIAALCRIPATLGVGGLIDRFGPRRVVIVSNLLQVSGFTSYLFVHSFGHLVASAVVVQLGNSAFWVAYPALVQEAARGTSQESWFGVITGLRYAGLGLGGVAAGAAVGVGGNAGYHAIVAANAVSFAAAALLVLLDRSRPALVPVPHHDRRRPASWSAVLHDRSFLLFVVLTLGFALLTLAFGVAVPVYLVNNVGLPAWVPGGILAINAALGALGAAPVLRLVRGRRRSISLVAAQLATALGYGCLLATAGVPPAAGIAFAICAAVCITVMELVQGTIVPAVVNESADDHTRGRYNSVYQLAFGIGDIVSPALLTALLTHGALATWTPLVALALANCVGIVLIARLLEPLRRRTGSVPQTSEDERLLEADGL
jgi:MFS family permease